MYFPDVIPRLWVTVKDKALPFPVIVPVYVALPSGPTCIGIISYTMFNVPRPLVATHVVFATVQTNSAVAPVLIESMYPPVPVVVVALRYFML